MKITTTAERLKELMSEKNLKQVEIIEMSKPYQKKYDIKMGKSALSQYVSGKSSPDQHKLFLLSQTLNVSEPWLMGFDVPKEIVVTEDKTEAPTLLSIYEKLDKSRQLEVYAFAKYQLEEQNEVRNSVINADFSNDNKKTIVTNRRTAAGSALHVDDGDARKEVVSSALIPKGADELVEVSGQSMEPLIKDGQKVYIRYQPIVENGEIAIVRIENEGVTCKRVYRNNGTITLKSENPEYSDMHFDSSQVTVLGKVLI